MSSSNSTGQLPWGAKMSDFRVGGAGQKRSASSTITGGDEKKSKTHGQELQPTLAKDPDGLLGIVEDMEWDEAQADAAKEAGEDLGDTSDLGGLTHDDVMADGEEEADEASEDVVREVSRESSLQMPDSVVDNMVNAMTGAYQEFPSEDVMNELPRDIPETEMRNINRHQKQYTAVVNQIFDTARVYTEATVRQSPFNLFFLLWLQANDSEEIRARLCEFLLHPLVRSYRCQNALGRRPRRSQKGLLFKELQCHPLTEDVSAVPNVAGVYLLHGVSGEGIDQSKDPIYVGQAASAKFTSAGAVGMRRRAEQHWQGIQKVQTSDEHHVPKLSAHARFGQMDIEGVEIAVLSMFPFPVAEMGEATLRHYLPILTLAETVDMLLCGSLSALTDHEVPKCIGSREALARITPGKLHERSYQGLNRALSINQWTSRLAGVISSFNFSAPEVASFIDIVAKFEEEVYVYAASGYFCIQYDVLVSQLRLRGIEKTLHQVKLLYSTLAVNPDSGLLTRQASRWRRKWDHIYGVKRHLESKGLVEGPMTHYDIMYHIPKLENGLKNVYHFGELLEESGYADYQHLKAVDTFWQHYLPRLLRKDVWEQIEASPPERLSATRQVIPQDIYNRTVDVIVHYARPILLERGVVINSDTPLLPSLKWSHFDLLKIWHYAAAQLSADGVPHKHILTGGQLCIGKILRRFSKRLLDNNPLPQWKYNPAKRKPSTLPNLGETTTIESEDAPKSTQDVDSGDESDGETTEPYKWPSEEGRYEAIVTAHEVYASAGKHKGQQAPNVLKIPVIRAAPCEMGQNRTSTLRTLAIFMREIHQKVFDPTIGVYDRDENFWENLYIDLNNSWGNYRETVEMRIRFEWVLELIRTGELSSEAQTAFDIVVEALTGTSLPSQTHPYSSETGCDVAGLFGPDLSREWAKRFFEINKVLQTVKRAIESRMPNFGIDGFCYRYGLLVVRAGEQAMAQAGHLPSLEDVQCDEGEQPSSEPKTANSEGPTNLMISGRPALSVQIPEAMDRSQSLSPPPSPGPYSPLLGNPVTGKIRGYHKNEIEYLTYLAHCHHLTVKEKVDKFYLKFPFRHRTRDAIELKISRLKLELLKAQGGQAKEQRPWSDDDHNLLLTQLDTCDNWDEVTAGMEAESPKGRTKTSIQDYARRNNLDTSRLYKNTWDDVQERFLIKLLQTCDTWDQVTAAFEAEFLTGRNTAAIQAYARRKKLDYSRLSKAIKWTNERDEFIKTLHARQTPPREYPGLFKEEFGIEVSLNACTHRRSKLGLMETKNGTHWSPEELDFLAENSGLEDPDFHAKFVAEFGQERSRDAILQQLKKFRKGKSTTLRHQTRTWTAEQDQLLQSVAHLTPDEVYAAYCAKFGDTRTKAAVMKRIQQMKRTNKL
ncbi:hypothetical protein NQ176_g3259 [Zarea fungicola]|uniref:Uncharacterized protein n=1 Tax=Zarea fungicola TaxID=93591 RepID=A0ACC1NJD7_9HYPO|nr:hypothetical protein NQ176_g3259 [Lecanicillium fungicola]